MDMGHAHSHDDAPHPGHHSRPRMSASETHAASTRGGQGSGAIGSDNRDNGDRRGSAEALSSSSTSGRAAAPPRPLAHSHSHTHTASALPVNNATQAVAPQRRTPSTTSASTSSSSSASFPHRRPTTSAHSAPALASHAPPASLPAQPDPTAGVPAHTHAHAHARTPTHPTHAAQPPPAPVRALPSIGASALATEEAAGAGNLTDGGELSRAPQRTRARGQSRLLHPVRARAITDEQLVRARALLVAPAPADNGEGARASSRPTESTGTGTGERDAYDLRHHPAFGGVQWGLAGGAAAGTRGQGQGQNQDQDQGQGRGAEGERVAVVGPIAAQAPTAPQAQPQSEAQVQLPWRAAGRTARAYVQPARVESTAGGGDSDRDALLPAHGMHLSAASDFAPDAQDLEFYQTPLSAYLQRLLHSGDDHAGEQDLPRHYYDELLQSGSPQDAVRAPAPRSGRVRSRAAVAQQRFLTESPTGVFGRADDTQRQAVLLDSPRLLGNGSAAASCGCGVCAVLLPEGCRDIAVSSPPPSSPSSPPSSSSSSSSSASSAASTAHALSGPALAIAPLLPRLPPLPVALREACGPQLGVYAPHQYLHALHYHLQEVRAACGVTPTRAEALEEQSWVKPLGENWDLGKSEASVSFRGFPRACCTQLVAQTDALEAAIVAAYTELTGTGEVHDVHNPETKRKISAVAAQHLQSFPLGSEQRIAAEVVLRLLLLRDQHMQHVRRTHRLGALLLLQAQLPEDAPHTAMLEMLSRSLPVSPPVSPAAEADAGSPRLLQPRTPTHPPNTGTALSACAPYSSLQPAEGAHHVAADASSAARGGLAGRRRRARVRYNSDRRSGHSSGDSSRADASHTEAAAGEPPSGVRLSRPSPSRAADELVTVALRQALAEHRAGQSQRDEQGSQAPYAAAAPASGHVSAATAEDGREADRQTTANIAPMPASAGHASQRLVSFGSVPPPPCFAATLAFDARVGCSTATSDASATAVETAPAAHDERTNARAAGNTDAVALEADIPKCVCDGCTFGAAQSWMLSEGPACQPLLTRHDHLSLAAMAALLAREARRQRTALQRERAAEEAERRRQESALRELAWDTMLGLRYPWVRQEMGKALRLWCPLPAPLQELILEYACPALREGALLDVEDMRGKSVWYRAVVLKVSPAAADADAHRGQWLARVQEQEQQERLARARAKYRADLARRLSALDTDAQRTAASLHDVALRQAMRRPRGDWASACSGGLCGHSGCMSQHTHSAEPRKLVIGCSALQDAHHGLHGDVNLWGRFGDNVSCTPAGVRIPTLTHTRTYALTHRHDTLAKCSGKCDLCAGACVEAEAFCAECARERAARGDHARCVSCRVAGSDCGGKGCGAPGCCPPDGMSCKCHDCTCAGLPPCPPSMCGASSRMVVVGAVLDAGALQREHEAYVAQMAATVHMRGKRGALDSELTGGAMHDACGGGAGGGMRGCVRIEEVESDSDNGTLQEADDVASDAKCCGTCGASPLHAAAMACSVCASREASEGSVVVSVGAAADADDLSACAAVGSSLSRPRSSSRVRDVTDKPGECGGVRLHLRGGGDGGSSVAGEALVMPAGDAVTTQDSSSSSSGDERASPLPNRPAPLSSSPARNDSGDLVALLPVLVFPSAPSALSMSPSVSPCIQISKRARRPRGDGALAAAEDTPVALRVRTAPCPSDSIAAIDTCAIEDHTAASPASTGVCADTSAVSPIAGRREVLPACPALDDTLDSSPAVGLSDISLADSHGAVSLVSAPIAMPSTPPRTTPSAAACQRSPCSPYSPPSFAQYFTPLAHTDDILADSQATPLSAQSGCAATDASTHTATAALMSDHPTDASKQTQADPIVVSDAAALEPPALPASSPSSPTRAPWLLLENYYADHNSRSERQRAPESGHSSAARDGGDEDEDEDEDIAYYGDLCDQGGNSDSGLNHTHAGLYYRQPRAHSTAGAVSSIADAPFPLQSPPLRPLSARRGLSTSALRPSSSHSPYGCRDDCHGYGHVCSSGGRACELPPSISVDVRDGAPVISIHHAHTHAGPKVYAHTHTQAPVATEGGARGLRLESAGADLSSVTQSAASTFTATSNPHHDCSAARPAATLSHTYPPYPYTLPELSASIHTHTPTHVPALVDGPSHPPAPTASALAGSRAHDCRSCARQGYVADGAWRCTRLHDCEHAFAHEDHLPAHKHAHIHTHLHTHIGQAGTYSHIPHGVTTASHGRVHAHEVDALSDIELGCGHAGEGHHSHSDGYNGSGGGVGGLRPLGLPLLSLTSPRAHTHDASSTASTPTPSPGSPPPLPPPQSVTELLEQTYGPCIAEADLPPLPMNKKHRYASEGPVPGLPCAQVLVHYLGWNSRWDEWVPVISKRLSPPGTRIPAGTTTGPDYASTNAQPPPPPPMPRVRGEREEEDLRIHQRFLT